MIRRFYLQLFADQAEAQNSELPADATANTAEKEEQTQPPHQQAPAATLKNPEEPKYTDKEVDEILNRKFAEWQKKQQKAVDEAKKLSEMNAQQKAEYERDKLQKELDELKRISALSEMSKTARKMLSENGITVSEDLLSVMVTDKAETTKAAVDGFAQMFTEAVEAAVKERLKGEPPRKGSGGAATMTKEQIMAIRDPELRQQKMLENKHLFNF
ncbi:MAG: DUF4355 domain-containing protein [Christensenellales bacterium]